MLTDIVAGALSAVALAFIFGLLPLRSKMTARAPDGAKIRSDK